MLAGLYDEEEEAKEMRNIFYCSYLSGPTQKLKEIVADQIAPEYWVSNQDSDVMSTLSG